MSWNNVSRFTNQIFTVTENPKRKKRELKV